LAGRLAILTILALVGGCAVGPDYERPTLDVPDQFIEATSTDPSIANLPWWELFNDRRLVALIRSALDNNQDLAITIARIDESAALLGVVRADQFPVLDAATSAGRVSASEDLVPFADSRDDYFLGASAAFEIDLWGKLRRATEGARADLLSTEAVAQSVTISLIAQVATTYLLLRDLDHRYAVSQRTLGSREDSLDIIRARFERGIVPELDVNQADVEAADAQAAVAAFERQVAQIENALRVLIGANPGTVTRGLPLDQQTVPVDVPVGLPVALLERRPDVRAAEEAFAAETARIGVARALRLPSLGLTGSYGSATDDFDNLLDNASEQWDFFGSIFAPIFNAGQLKAQEQAQIARAQQARLRYELAVLSALRDVEDALTAIRTFRDEHTARMRQLAAAQTAARLSRARYDGGIVSYLEVLDTERSLFQSELLESTTRQQSLSAVVQLYRALGGGWSAQ
jgi:multidrug efflux system outer membrane protein